MLAPPAVVNSRRRHRAAINAIIARMADRYYVTFPGYDEKIGQGLTWDGKEHDLVIKIDKDDTDAEPARDVAEVGAAEDMAGSRGGC